jgi:hypothetical protein
MHQLPNVDETERYITERLLIAGSDQPNVFTPGAVDFIYQCSEGIPRQINNICDNAMLAGYAAGEQIIGRQIIEDVAENLDLLPEKKTLFSNDNKTETITSARILTAEGREELSNGGRARTEQPKSAFVSDAAFPKNDAGFANTNFTGVNRRNLLDDLDDDVSLEIEEVGGFY